MYKPSDRQAQLFDASSQLTDSARKRLKNGWAEGFRRRVMPILFDVEDEFADLYDSETGRGCWSVARKLGLLLLQARFDTTDEQTVGALSFDTRWQYALMLTEDEAYLSRVSMWDFRCRLIEADPEMERLSALVSRIAEEAADELGLDLGDQQRTDSTHITSNITTKSRADLFRKVLTHFDNELQKRWPDQRSRLSEDLVEWLDAEPEHWFGRLSDDEYQARMTRMADWVLEIVETFRDHDEIAVWEPYQVVVQLLEEHCVVDLDDPPDTDGPDDEPPAVSPGTDADTKAESTQGADSAGTASDDEATEDEPTTTVKLRYRPRGGNTALQSPYDPDAGYTSHKGTGYSMHIVETCGHDEQLPEMIVDQMVEPADTDTGKMTSLLEDLDERGLLPTTMLADAGYGTGGAIVEAAQMGVELVAPVPQGNQDQERFGRERFEIDEETGQVQRCPAGNKPCRHGTRRSASHADTDTLHAYFYPSHCESCEHVEQCPVRPPDSGRGAYQLELRDNQLARDRRLAAQKTDEFWEDYRLRSGVEATASELKRAHGVGDLRIRRLPRVRMEAALKACACNIKRWVGALLEQDGGFFTLLVALTGLFSRLMRSASPLRAAETSGDSRRRAYKFCTRLRIAAHSRKIALETRVS